MSALSPEPEVGILRQLGELSAKRAFLAGKETATREAALYRDARALREYDRSWKLAREVNRLRAKWEKTSEHQAADEADRRYQAFVAEHRSELEAMVEPHQDMTPEQYEARRAGLQAEAERLAPLVPDPDRPLPWDYQLALDDLHGFEHRYHPEVYPESEPEAGL